MALKCQLCENIAEMVYCKEGRPIQLLCRPCLITKQQIEAERERKLNELNKQNMEDLYSEVSK